MNTRQSAAALQAYRKLHRAKVAPVEEVLQTSEAANWVDDGGQGALEQLSETEAAIRSTFNFRCILENRVAIAERAGKVALSGSVQDRYEYWLAEYTAAHCPGVKRVSNGLVIEPLHEEGSDRWIEYSIVRALLTKAEVARGSVSVEVRGGAVTLRGWARNLARKGQVEACAAEIPGVRSVSNDIRIGERSGVSAEKRDDASIVGQVRSALRGNPLTRTFNGRVSSNDGFVAMVGDAASEAERSQAAKVALGVSGVKSVSNGLTVKG